MLGWFWGWNDRCGGRVDANEKGEGDGENEGVEGNAEGEKNTKVEMDERESGVRVVRWSLGWKPKVGHEENADDSMEFWDLTQW